MNVESASCFHLLASINVLNGSEEGGVAREHSPGKEEVGGLAGAVGGWQSDLVNKTAENNSLHFNI